MRRRGYEEELPKGNKALSGQEQQVLSCIASGFSNKEIASKLGMSASTVNGHLHNIFLKLGVSNRTALAVMAVTNLCTRPLQDDANVSARGLMGRGDSGMRGAGKLKF